jgi:hypothetical protein
MVISSRQVIVNFELVQQTLSIDGVTVTSGFYENENSEPVSITSLGYEELRRSPGGFEDVLRGISILPGVAKQSAGRNDLVVRGGAPSENLYLLDGFVVPNINHFATQGATGGTNSYVDLDFVEKANFSTGGFSVKYGDKLSSTLDIKLRDGRKDKIGGKALISASQFGLNLEGPLSENDNFLFSIRRSYLDFIFNAFGFSFVPQYWDMLFKYNHNFKNNDKLSFLFVGAKDDINFNYNKREDFLNNSRILANEQRQYTSGISYRHLFKNGFADFRIGRNYVTYNASQKDSLLNPIFLNKSVEATNNISTDVVLKTSKKSELNFGGNFDVIRSKNNILFPSQFRTSFGETLPLTNSNTDNYYYKSALYVLYSYTFFNQLIFNSGLRGDYFGAIKNGLTVSPRFSLKWQYSPISSIALSTGIYRQSPSYIWLVYPGNDNLKPIKVNQYIFAFDYFLSPDIKTKVELFYKNYNYYPASTIRNYLVLSNSGAGFGGSEDDFSSLGLEPLASSGTGFSRGIEFSIQKKPAETPLFGIASLSYSQTKFTALDKIERNGQFDQTIILNLSAGYMLGNSWLFSAKFRFASGFPFTPYHAFGTRKVEEYLSKRLPNSHSLDIRVDKIWTFNSLSLITYIDIQNIYNRKNVTGVRWDYVTNQEIEQKEFGILPTIGVSIEF